MWLTSDTIHCAFWEEILHRNRVSTRGRAQMRIRSAREGQPRPKWIRGAGQERRAAQVRWDWEPWLRERGKAEVGVTGAKAETEGKKREEERDANNLARQDRRAGHSTLSQRIKPREKGKEGAGLYQRSHKVPKLGKEKIGEEEKKKKKKKRTETSEVDDKLSKCGASMEHA